MHDCILGSRRLPVCRPFVAFCNRMFPPGGPRTWGALVNCLVLG